LSVQGGFREESPVSPPVSGIKLPAAFSVSHSTIHLFWILLFSRRDGSRDAGFYRFAHAGFP